jgi:hypothetical protein
MPALTPARLAILKLIAAFNGQNGPFGVEAMMKGLSGIPESEWTPIRSHLDALEDFGLIRPEVSENCHGRYWMTDRGRKLVDG